MLTAPPSAVWDAEFWRMLRHTLACRSGGRCEICGGFLGAADEGTVHHRQPRGMAGSRDLLQHSIERLLLLCGGRLGGVCGCHGLVESRRSWAFRNGYLVPHPVPGQETDATDCAKVPVTLWSGRRVLLIAGAPEYRQAPGVPYTVRPMEDLAAV